MIVEKPHMATQHSLRAYLQYTVIMVCAMGLKFSGLVSHQNIPSKFSKTRFPLPPKLVICDNACRLHVYCLNREPNVFKET